ncbi:MAG: retron system putative HNH endonuclease [Pseudanabaena sp. ELA607]|jgi:uncharacterized protein (TIGR02646 family)
MRNIQKVAEPRSLTQHRCNTNSNYENYAEKDDLRKSLVSEQRGICCYCMQRIRPNLDSMKIEHWQCQDKYPTQQLDYDNLLGACLGGKGKSKRDQHCDTSKGNDDISFNPADPLHDVESKLQFLGDGTIQSSDLQFNQEINDVLNLNSSLLTRNRKAVLITLQQSFMRGNPSKIAIEKELRKWNGDDGGDLEPFCQVVIYYLRKKLRKMI